MRDLACGAGLLLQQLLVKLPDADAFGVDASTAMLAQARLTLRGHPRVHLDRAHLGSGATANPAYGPAAFDLITCTNAWHYLSEPGGQPRGLASGRASGWGGG